jgi:hypothetical protein
MLKIIHDNHNNINTNNTELTSLELQTVYGGDGPCICGEVVGRETGNIALEDMYYWSYNEFQSGPYIAAIIAHRMPGMFSVEQCKKTCANKNWFVIINEQIQASLL